LPKDVRLKGTCSSGADNDRSDRVLLRVVMWRLRCSYRWYESANIRKTI